MGKSPAKWIRTLLSAKKSSRSHSSKGRDASKTANDKEYVGGKGPLAVAVNSPVISQPVPDNTERYGINPESGNGAPSSLPSDEAVVLPISQVAEKQGVAEPGASNDPEKLREEEAAIKAQAAFRGYLARRAFRALKGIIRLQAVVRGHLVRRQAVSTLRSMQGIVKFQALVRGRRVRLSGIGCEVHTKFVVKKTVFVKLLDARELKPSTNAFVSKLLSSSRVAMPLQIQYAQGESNSVFNWLERWTFSRFWKPLSQLKKSGVSKSQTRRSSYSMETESGRPKRTVRRNSAASIDSGPVNVTSEVEKPKRNLKKVSNSPADSVQEHPQTELEKVKRNLRKVSNSTTEASDRAEVETEKPNRSLRKASSSPSDVADQGIEDLGEKMKKDIAVTPEAKPVLEATSILTGADCPVDTLHDDHPAGESHTLDSIGKEENLSLMNGDLSSKEEEACHENRQTSKRSASFPAKAENKENGLQTTPTLPSYMAATKSAKAKLRGQISPRSSSDMVEKNDFTRRHSLPSSINGRLSSHSPRTQRLVQANGKGGIRSDRSLLSSGDGNEKVIQVEWRR